MCPSKNHTKPSHDISLFPSNFQSFFQPRLGSVGIPWKSIFKNAKSLSITSPCSPGTSKKGLEGVRRLARGQRALMAWPKRWSSLKLRRTVCPGAPAAKRRTSVRCSHTSGTNGYSCTCIGSVVMGHVSHVPFSKVRSVGCRYSLRSPNVVIGP